MPLDQKGNEVCIMEKNNNKSFVILFLTLPILLFTCLIIIPTGMTLFYSLHNWDGINKMEFVGLKNFIELFDDRNYKTSVKNTFTLVAIALVFQLGFGIVIAFVLARTKVLFKFFRTTFFMPSVISAAAISVLFVCFFNTDVGAFNVILSKMGFGEAIADKTWLSDPDLVLYFVAVPSVWQYMGQQIIIFLAAIQGLSEEMFEAAEIDGANSFTMFFKIVLPNMKEIIEVVAVLVTTGALKAFDHSWIMTWGGPGSSSAYMAVQMYKEVFKNGNFGYGSAIAISILFISLALVVIFKSFFAMYIKKEG